MEIVSQSKIIYISDETRTKIDSTAREQTPSIDMRGEDF